MLSQGFWTAIFAIGVVQGVFLVGVLFLQRGTNRIAARILAMIVAAFTLIILGEVLERVLPPRLALLAVFLSINFELAIGPLAYLFVGSLLDPSRQPTRRDALHFAPLVVGLCVWATAWLLLADRLVAAGWNIQQAPMLPHYVLFKACFMLLYAFATFRALTRGLAKPRKFSAGRRSVGLEWLKRWTLGLSAIPGVIYLTVFLERRGIDTGFESDQVASLALTGMIYLASLLVLLQPWVLTLRPRSRPAVRWASEAAELTSFLEGEQPWLRPELSLHELAGALGSTENRLSAVINEGLGLSFYGLISRYRLAEFERLARDPAFRERSVLDLAFEAGFNSKASFYRVFREAHGTTPAAYRASL